MPCTMNLALRHAPVWLLALALDTRDRVSEWVYQGFGTSRPRCT